MTGGSASAKSLSLSVLTCSSKFTVKFIGNISLSDQIRLDIGLLKVDKRNSTIHSRNDTRNNVNE